jgi:murein L,D-transpeptidase YcbB/YkuD
MGKGLGKGVEKAT